VFRGRQEIVAVHPHSGVLFRHSQEVIEMPASMSDGEGQANKHQVSRLVVTSTSGAWNPDTAAEFGIKPISTAHEIYGDAFADVYKIRLRADAADSPRSRKLVETDKQCAEVKVDGKALLNIECDSCDFKNATKCRWKSTVLKVGCDSEGKPKNENILGIDMSKINTCLPLPDIKQSLGLDIQMEASLSIARETQGRYKTSTFKNGQSRCRDTVTGRFARTALCAPSYSMGGYSLEGHLNATAGVTLFGIELTVAEFGLVVLPGFDKKTKKFKVSYHKKLNFPFTPSLNDEEDEEENVADGEDEDKKMDRNQGSPACSLDSATKANEIELKSFEKEFYSKEFPFVAGGIKITIGVGLSGKLGLNAGFLGCERSGKSISLIYGSQDALLYATGSVGIGSKFIASFGGEVVVTLVSSESRVGGDWSPEDVLEGKLYPTCLRGDNFIKGLGVELSIYTKGFAWDERQPIYASKAKKIFSMGKKSCNNDISSLAKVTMNDNDAGETSAAPAEI